jgi:hypothetical protein
MDVPVARRFVSLRGEQPELSDSMILNSNNQSVFTGEADVVVARAGMLGLSYAIHLRKIAPHLKIEVILLHRRRRLVGDIARLRRP